MKLPILSLLLALTAPLSMATPPDSAGDNGCQASKNTAKYCAKFSAYGRYFGFEDMQQYLHFAHSLERLIDNGLATTESTFTPIDQDPQLTGYRKQLTENTVISASQKVQVQQNYHQRRQALAQHLNVPTAQLDDYLARYLSYRTLDQELHNINHPDKLLPVSSDRELICDSDCQQRFETDELMRIAQTHGIGPLAQLHRQLHGV